MGPRIRQSHYRLPKVCACVCFLSDSRLNHPFLDGSKVESQTPEGTRVGTPSAAPSTSKGSGPRGWSSGKGSYASALKAKQTDWHLEFSMDDPPLPLDLTIYGAIHQHELRKKK